MTINYTSLWEYLIFLRINFQKWGIYMDNISCFQEWKASNYFLQNYHFFSKDITFLSSVNFEKD
jgi:hypothetical protein